MPYCHTVRTVQHDSVRARAESQLVDSHSVLSPKLGQRTKPVFRQCCHQFLASSFVLLYHVLLYYCIIVFLDFWIWDLLRSFVSNQWLSWPPANKFSLYINVNPVQIIHTTCFICFICNLYYLSTSFSICQPSRVIYLPDRMVILSKTKVQGLCDVWADLERAKYSDKETSVSI